MIDPEKLSEKLKELILPEIDTMSSVTIYDLLTGDQGSRGNVALSPLQKFKRIINGILKIYDLEPESDNVDFLAGEAMEFRYLHRSPFFQHQYKFDLHITQDKVDKYCTATLLRSRIGPFTLTKKRLLMPISEAIHIPHSYLPSLLDDDTEYDLTRLMHIIRLVVAKFAKIFHLNPSTQPTPLVDPDDIADFSSILAGEAGGSTEAGRSTSGTAEISAQSAKPREN